MFYNPPADALPWAIAMVSTGLFGVMIWIRLHGKKSLLNSLMRTIFVLLPLGYAFWYLPFFFTVDALLYTIFFVFGDLFSHLALFLMGILFWEVVLEKQVQRKIWKRLYLMILASLGILAYVSLTKYILENNFVIRGGDLIFGFKGIGLLAYSIYVLPAGLLGLYFIGQARKSAHWTARLKSLSIGFTMAAVGLSITGQYLSDYFTNDQTTGSIAASVSYYYMAFFATNLIAIFVSDKREKSQLHMKEVKTQYE